MKGARRSPMTLVRVTSSTFLNEAFVTSNITGSTDKHSFSLSSPKDRKEAQFSPLGWCPSVCPLSATVLRSFGCVTSNPQAAGGRSGFVDGIFFSDDRQKKSVVKTKEVKKSTKKQPRGTTPPGGAMTAMQPFQCLITCLKPEALRLSPLVVGAKWEKYWKEAFRGSKIGQKQAK